MFNAAKEMNRMIEEFRELARQSLIRNWVYWSGSGLLPLTPEQIHCLQYAFGVPFTDVLLDDLYETVVEIKDLHNPYNYTTRQWLMALRNGLSIRVSEESRSNFNYAYYALLGKISGEVLSQALDELEFAL